MSCDLLTNGCGSPNTSAHPTLLPCYTVGKLHPKPYTAKIQSAVTICGGYLGHDVPRKKKKKDSDGEMKINVCRLITIKNKTNSTHH